jgi:two-component sensor histidine kinase
VLSSSVNMSYSSPAKEIRFEYEIQPGISLEIDMMIPIGLILNEILSNSYKYAFEGMKQGMIHIGLKQAKKELVLVVHDNGKGLDKKFDLKKQGSLGMQLIHMLSEQIEAKMKVSSGKGTRYDIIFPMK